jgi:O-antigen ligase
MSVSVPRVAIVALVFFYAGLTFTALVGAFSGQPGSGFTSHLSREALYPLALVIGLIAGTAALRDRRLLSSYRALAWVALAIYLSSIVYWLWTDGSLSGSTLDSLFEPIKSQVYGAHRSIFPFSEDSPNLAAVAFVLVAAFTSPPLLSRDRGDRLLGILVMIGALGAVLTTQSRTGVFALAAAALAMWFGRSRSGSSVRLLLTGAGAVIALVLVSAAVLPQSRELSFTTGTFQARQEIWQQAWDTFGGAPLIGRGFDYSAGSRFSLSGTTGSPSFVTSAHSEPLAQLVDGGLLGATLFLIVAGSFVWLGARLRRRSLPEGCRTGYLALLFAAAVAMVDSVLTKSAVCITVLWLFFGFACALLTAQSREKIR